MQGLRPVAEEARPHDGAARARLGPAPAERRLGDHRRSRPEQVLDNVAASGVELSEETLAAIDEAVGAVAIS